MCTCTPSLNKQTDRQPARQAENKHTGRRTDVVLMPSNSVQISRPVCCCCINVSFSACLTRMATRRITTVQNQDPSISWSLCSAPNTTTKSTHKTNGGKRHSTGLSPASLSTPSRSCWATALSQQSRTT